MRPDPAARPGLSVWLRLMKTHNLILKRARRTVGGGLTLPQFDAMVQLERRPEGMTSAELSRSLLVTAGNVTGIVHRLERAGLAAREAHERDGRARRIRLTPAGRRRLARLRPRHARAIESLLGRLPLPELLRLRELLGRLAESLQETDAAAAAPQREHPRRQAR